MVGVGGPVDQRRRERGVGGEMMGGHGTITGRHLRPACVAPRRGLDLAQSSTGGDMPVASLLSVSSLLPRPIVQFLLNPRPSYSPKFAPLPSLPLPLSPNCTPLFTPCLWWLLCLGAPFSFTIINLHLCVLLLYIFDVLDLQEPAGMRGLANN